jgi:gliding-associated putative ABC transporter substrate-binding component GldG
MKRKYGSGMMTGALLVIITLIAVFINVVVAQLPPLRLDLTDQGLFSLSESTRNVAKRLQDRIKIEAYFTRDLPAPYNQHATYVRDVLEEYAIYAGGNLAYEFVDPGTDETRKRDVVRKGIQPVQIQEIKNDQIGIKQAFMGIVVTYGAKKEIIPLVRNPGDLEFELTSIIKRLTAQQMKTIAFAAGHGEVSLDEKMQRLRSALQKSYNVTVHDFGLVKEIAHDVSTLMIVGPTEKWSDEDLFHLDQFVMRGGTAAFLLDNFQVDMAQLSGAVPIDHGLSDLLTFYGVKPEQNLIVDPQCKRITVETRQGMYQIRNVINYPYFPSLTDLNRDHVVTKELGSISLPFMSSLTLLSSQPSATGTVLARTSPRSWEERDNFQINPLQRIARPEKAVPGPFNGVAAAGGRFISYFAGKAGEGGAEYIKDPASVLKESVDTRFLVAGSGTMARDDGGDQEDMAFLVNLADWLAQDPEMISIRNRGIADRPVVELSPGAKSALRYANVVGVPALFILFGVMRWQWRKARLRQFSW